MNSLAMQVQEALGRDPHAGDLYVFRGARGDLIKIVWQTGSAMATTRDDVLEDIDALRAVLPAERSRAARVEAELASGPSQVATTHFYRADVPARRDQ